jgi:hypothetical protein
VSFSSLFFVSPQAGWVVGNLSNNAGGFIYKVTNGGLNYSFTILSERIRSSPHAFLPREAKA